MRQGSPQYEPWGLHDGKSISQYTLNYNTPTAISVNIFSKTRKFKVKNAPYAAVAKNHNYHHLYLYIGGSTAKSPYESDSAKKH